MQAHVLLIDPDAGRLARLSAVLLSGGYAVTTVPRAEAALAQLAIGRPHVLVTAMDDVVVPGAAADSALIDAVTQVYPTLPIIAYSAQPSVAQATAAMEQGAFSYLTGVTDDPAGLLREVGLAVAVGTVGAVATAGVAATDEDGTAWCSEILTRNPAMTALLAQARLVASGEARVLLYGESGTGKELLARSIHRASPRRAAPFLAVNCGAIPEHLMESELFGHIKGAFTGAMRDHPGLFVAAEGGTLLLDEIGDIPLHLQVKLLRVLEERQVRPVGASRDIPINVRIIAATHRRLEDEIAAGRFREDLFYRLNVVMFKLPALAVRRDDIALLANHFLQQLSARYDRAAAEFEPGVIELLAAANWPGNIRQLFNVMEHALVVASNGRITCASIRKALRESGEMMSLDAARHAFESEYLQRLLQRTRGNVTHAARQAGRNRTEFYKLMQRHGISPAAFGR